MTRWLLGVGLWGCASTGTPQVIAAAERDELAPEFSLLDADGQEHRLEDQRGTPVVIDFSAAWCGRCQDAAAEIEAVHQQRPDVVAWTVLFDDPSGDDPDASDLAGWVEAFQLTHTVLGDVDREVFRAFGGGHQPIFHIVDAQGRMAWTDEASDAEDILAALDAL